jgi:GNAT superfamily N-acetyltransferase
MELTDLTDLRIVPANQAGCDDLQMVFGTRGSAVICQCQRYKLAPKEAFKHHAPSVRALRLEAQTQCGQPTAASTTGLVAYLGDEPVGWCAVEPRANYDGLRRVYRVPWEGRSEDKADPSIWAVTCFFVRAGFRGRGISRALARAAVAHARERGAQALEGYPMLRRPDGADITWDEIHVGAQSIFTDAGFREVNRPGVRRAVMRIDF